MSNSDYYSWLNPNMCQTGKIGLQWKCVARWLCSICSRESELHLNLLTIRLLKKLFGMCKIKLHIVLTIISNVQLLAYRDISVSVTFQTRSTVDLAQFTNKLVKYYNVKLCSVVNHLKSSFLSCYQLVHIRVHIIAYGILGCVTDLGRKRLDHNSQQKQLYIHNAINPSFLSIIPS